MNNICKCPLRRLTLKGGADFGEGQYTGLVSYQSHTLQECSVCPPGLQI